MLRDSDAVLAGELPNWKEIPAAGAAVEVAAAGAAFQPATVTGAGEVTMPERLLMMLALLDAGAADGGSREDGGWPKAGKLAEESPKRGLKDTSGAPADEAGAEAGATPAAEVTAGVLVAAPKMGLKADGSGLLPPLLLMVPIAKPGAMVAHVAAVEGVPRLNVMLVEGAVLSGGFRG